MLSGDILKKKAEDYFTIMKTRYRKQKYDSAKWPSDLFEEKDPWLNMNSEEIKSMLAIEYMKLILGKTQGKEVGALLYRAPLVSRRRAVQNPAFRRLIFPGPNQHGFAPSHDDLTSQAGECRVELDSPQLQRSQNHPYRPRGR